MDGALAGSFELRLFLEEICCNLCRFRHVAEDSVAPESVQVAQEVPLGPGAFADIRVEVPGKLPYYLEVDHGYAPERAIQSLARKYGGAAGAGEAASKVIVVLDGAACAHFREHAGEWRAALRPGLDLEVWDEPALLERLRASFGVSLASITAADLLDVREAIDRAKGAHAFGAQQKHDAVESSLLWHFGFWRLRQLLEAGRTDARSILLPGLYTDVVVVMADLAGFSSYVRDTRDERIVRECLTSFYSKSRYQIINYGGMMYQFLGDAVIALFGIPDRPRDYVQAALECARSLSSIGDSVSNEWQRQIDRLQSESGVHIGMTLGDISIMPLQPFARSHVGAIGDAINMAARLQSGASTGELVASNTLYQRLDPRAQSRFREVVVEARNVGRIRAFRLDLKGEAAGAALA